MDRATRLLLIYILLAICSILILILVPIFTSKTVSTPSNAENFERPNTRDSLVGNPEQWLDSFLKDTVPSWNIPDTHLLVCSGHCTLPTFVEAQIESLAAFSKLPFTLVVVNDAPRDDYRQMIENKCQEYSNVIHVHFPVSLHQNRILLFPDTQEPHIGEPSTRASDVVQFMLQILRKHNGYGLILDSDAALIGPFHPSDLLDNSGQEKYSYAAPSQMRTTANGEIIDYLWIVVMLFNMKTFLNPEYMNVDCGWIKNTRMDTGGFWYTYFEKTKRQNMPKYLDLNCTEPSFLEFKQKDPHFEKIECYNNRFMHFHNGSNWEATNEQAYLAQTQIWLDYIRSIIANPWK